MLEVRYKKFERKRGLQIVDGSLFMPQGSFKFIIESLISYNETMLEHMEAATSIVARKTFELRATEALEIAESIKKEVGFCDDCNRRKNKKDDLEDRGMDGISHAASKVDYTKKPKDDKKLK